MSGPILPPARVHQINVSPQGGLPKHPVAGPVWVRRQGVEGDFNRYRTEHLGGDPDSAVLLLSLSTLETLAREGYPVGPGSLGENFTLAGIEEDQLSVGQTLRLGSLALVQVSRPCLPCYQVQIYGTDFLRRIRGHRGAYARVLEEGPVRTGDPVFLQG
jgi:MOSC domain-containing protein YiiM